MKYAWIASHLEQWSFNAICSVLGIKKSSFYSWAQLDHEKAESNQHSLYQRIGKAFYFLRQNGGTRSIKAYLNNEEGLVLSRRKIGNAMKNLGLKVKTKHKFKKQSTADAKDPKIKSNDCNGLINL